MESGVGSLESGNMVQEIDLRYDARPLFYRFKTNEVDLVSPSCLLAHEYAFVHHIDLSGAKFSIEHEVKKNQLNLFEA